MIEIGPLPNIVQARTKFLRETICQTQITDERLKDSVYNQQVLENNCR